MSEHGDLTALREQAVSDAATLVTRARAESQELLAAARAEADEIVTSAQRAAESIIVRAERKASVIDERARQEFLWRRRQLRQEHDVLARWKQAVASQLASVNTLAVETARDLFAAPELALGEDLTTDTNAAVDEAHQPAPSSRDATAQNSLSSALSSPRRAS